MEKTYWGILIYRVAEKSSRTGGSTSRSATDVCERFVVPRAERATDRGASRSNSYVLNAMRPCAVLAGNTLAEKRPSSPQRPWPTT
jgi:hypothetical protein